MEFVLNEYHRNVSDEELLNDIVRVARALGKESITLKEYKDNGGLYDRTTYTRRFGSWVNTLQKAGLQPTSAQIARHGIPEKTLICDIQRVEKILGKKTFYCSEYLQHGEYSKKSIFRRFKTWNDALIASGLEPFDHPLGGGTKNRISEYACFEEIERMWITLGRQPTTNDIKNGTSRYSLHVFERRFGTWRKALEAFVAYMNGENEVEPPNEPESIQLSVEMPLMSSDPESAHKTKRDINLRMRFMVMKRDNFKCCMCGRSPATTPGLELHIDHIIPWSKGGETVIDNLQTLCSDCNLGKSNLFEEDLD